MVRGKGFIFVNAKTYKQGTGDEAVALARICESVESTTGIPITLCLQPTDIKSVSAKVDLPIFSQHFDYDLPGKSTGKLIIESLEESGACGSLLNHSECRISLDNLKLSLLRAQEADFSVVCCAKDAREVRILSKLRPDFIAIEPPKLIGGEVSVSEADPKLIRDCVKAANKVPLLVGAGIKSSEDVRVARSLGASGVLLSSHVVLARDPKKVLLDLANGFL